MGVIGSMSSASETRSVEILAVDHAKRHYPREYSGWDEGCVNSNKGGQGVRPGKDVYFLYILFEPKK